MQEKVFRAAVVGALAAAAACPTPTTVLPDPEGPEAAAADRAAAPAATLAATPARPPERLYKISALDDGGVLAANWDWFLSKSGQIELLTITEPLTVRRKDADDRLIALPLELECPDAKNELFAIQAKIKDSDFSYNGAYFSMTPLDSSFLDIWRTNNAYEVGAELKKIPKTEISAKLEGGSAKIRLLIGYTVAAIDATNDLRTCLTNAAKVRIRARAKDGSKARDGGVVITDRVLVGGVVVLFFNARARDVDATLDIAGYVGAELSLDHKSLDAKYVQLGTTNAQVSATAIMDKLDASAAKPMEAVRMIRTASERHGYVAIQRVSVQ